MLTKAEIRESLKRELSTFDLSQRNIEEVYLSNELISILSENHWQTIGLYYGEFPEFQMEPLIARLLSLGYDVLLPRSERERQLSFRQIFDFDQLERSSFGVVQPREECTDIDPEKMDVIVVPGLGFRRDGFRIGFGGGYYDRYLSKHREIPTISLVLSCQIIEDNQWSPDNFDMAVHQLLIMEGGNGHKRES